MRCPSCGKLDDKVIESRTMASGDTIRRRRECISCHFRFTSYEKVEEKPFMVVKRDGRREPFDRSKIEKGIERAIEKRSIATTTVENLVIEVSWQCQHIYLLCISCSLSDKNQLYYRTCFCTPRLC